MAVIRRNENKEFDIAADWRASAEILGNGAEGLIDPKVLNSIVRSGRTVIVDLRERRFAGDSLLAARSDWVWIAPFRTSVFDGALLAAGTGSDDVTPDPMLAEALMHDVSRAAETALMYESEAERARLMSTLADFGSIAASLGDEANARQAAIAALKRLFPAEAGYLTSLEVGSGKLSVTQVFGARNDDADALEQLVATEECDSAQGCRAISRGGVYVGVGNDGLWDCPIPKERGHRRHVCLRADRGDWRGIAGHSRRENVAAILCQGRDRGPFSARFSARSFTVECPPPAGN